VSRCPQEGMYLVFFHQRHLPSCPNATLPPAVPQMAPDPALAASRPPRASAAVLRRLRRLTTHLTEPQVELVITFVKSISGPRPLPKGASGST
jgi:hypothetical protein